MQMMSTSEYLPPEAYSHTGIDERASDVWALGVTLTEMLLARNCFSLEEGDMPPRSLKGGARSKKFLRNKAIGELKKKAISPELVSLAEGLLEVDPLKRMTVAQVLESPYFKGIVL